MSLFDDSSSPGIYLILIRDPSAAAACSVNVIAVACIAIDSIKPRLSFNNFVVYFYLKSSSANLTNKLLSPIRHYANRTSGKSVLTNVYRFPSCSYLHSRRCLKISRTSPLTLHRNKIQQDSYDRFETGQTKHCIAYFLLTPH